MRQLATKLTCAAVLTAAAACSDPLEVRNVNSPDVERAYSTPALIEQLLATSVQQVFAATHAGSDAVISQMMVMSLESYASVANFGMAQRAAIPRQGISNERNNAVEFGNFRDFRMHSQQARSAANGVAALDRLIAGGGTLGSAGVDNTGLNRRARAFGFFALGMSLGNLALVYDSAAIVTPATPTDEVPPLSGAKQVMEAALQMLDSSIAIAAAPASASGFPLPAAWLAGAQLSQADFVRLVRSFKARYRASVARTPAERAAVNWDAVIADASNGIQDDVILQLGSGWGVGFAGSQMHVPGGWHQMSPMIYGMADTSRAYDAWLATPLAQRTPFLIKTPDKRFPQGETRAAQQAASPESPTYEGMPYIENREGQDTPGDPFGTSFYDFYRYQYIRTASGVGPFPFFTKAENDMLLAEGHIRKGNLAAAAALVDTYRARAGLPSVGSITSANQQIAGGNACVPRVPVGPSFATTQCATLFEAMKWEKRMETAFSQYGAWFFDARGWGDLPENTAVEWPVPYQEMDARQKPYYNIGGAGNPGAAPKGTYGF